MAIMLALPIVIAAMLMPEIAVASVMIPAMIVGNAAPFTLPVTLKEAFSVVSWAHPDGAGIRPSRPIALVPLVMISHWIPIAIKPKVFRTWSYRSDPHHPGWRRRTDPNPYGNLRGGDASA